MAGNLAWCALINREIRTGLNKHEVWMPMSSLILWAKIS